MDDLQGVGKDGFARLRARECQKSEGEDGFGAFAPNGSKLMSCRHPAGGKQGSTGALYLIVRILTSTQNKTADTERYQLFCGGGGRIRTIEAIRSRFTVCPLWPLGNSPIFNWLDLEPVDGLEPPTY